MDDSAISVCLSLINNTASSSSRECERSPIKKIKGNHHKNHAFISTTDDVDLLHAINAEIKFLSGTFMEAMIHADKKFPLPLKDQGQWPKVFQNRHDEVDKWHDTNRLPLLIRRRAILIKKMLPRPDSVEFKHLFANVRSWNALPPEILGLIFGNLSLGEVLGVVPLVCKAWAKGVTEPICWQVIDIKGCYRRTEAEKIDQMIRLVINRSQGSLRKVSVSGISNQTFSFLVNHSKYLEKLCFPRSEIENGIVVEVAAMLSNVTVLDISNCTKIRAQGLSAIGIHCKNLTVLRRIMHRARIDDSRNDEAMAIAHTMTNLKVLQISYLQVETLGVVEIIKMCVQLELIDLQGCRVKLDENFVKKFTKLKVIGPYLDRCHYSCEWDYDENEEEYLSDWDDWDDE